MSPTNGLGLPNIFLNAIIYNLYNIYTYIHTYIPEDRCEYELHFSLIGQKKKNDSINDF